MVLHDPALYQVVAGALTVGTTGFGLWSYLLKEKAEPPRCIAGEGVSVSCDLRLEMRDDALRSYASRSARATQWIAALLVIGAVALGLASLFVTSPINMMAFAGLAPILGAIVLGIGTVRALRVARACDRFDIEYVGNGRHKYESFESAWATFERAHPRDARIARRRIFAQRAAATVRFERAMADYSAGLERVMRSSVTPSSPQKWP